MDVNSFLIYQIAWYLFGTASAFAAALLFWQKGRAKISGREPGSGLGVHLSGAAGIFVSVLLVIHYINPLKLVIDPEKLLLVYSAAVESTLEGGEDAQFFLDSSEAIYSELLNDKVAPKLISAEHVFDLRRSVNNKAFITERPIPVGTYQLLLSNADTGELTTFYINVPSHNQENKL